MNDELQNMKEDWVECTLGEVSEIKMGQSPPSSTYNTDKIGLPFFQGKAEFSKLHPTVKKWCNEPKRIAEIDDILLSVRAPVGATNIANQKCAIGRGLAAISYQYSFQYLWFYLRLIERKLDEQGTGTTFRAISGNVLKSQIIPLAPLPIQRAIASKIESLFSDLDKGIENLKTAQAQLKTYRQAVLKKAFEGEYSTKKVIEFAVVKTGSTPKRGNSRFWENGIIPWITSGALNSSYVNKADELITEIALKETNCKIIPKGSLLVAMYGEGKTRGKCSELNIDAATNQAIATITMLDEYSNSKNYVKWFFIMNYEKIRLLSSGGVQPNLNLSIIKNTILPFPEHEIQKQIIEEIESRLSVTDNLEFVIRNSIKKSEALRQSILKKAFEGKLLSAAEIEACKQEADYEPAAKLLERIKNEKTKTKTKRKKP